MPERTVTHATFTIERIYDAPPARVFRAYADAAAKRRWFVEGEGWTVEEFVDDFRVGGIERSSFRFRGGPLIRNETIYHDIVPDRRIIIAYRMTVGDERISASLATIQLENEGRGTRHIFTEQGAYLDGHDDVAQREAGTRELHEALARELAR